MEGTVEGDGDGMGDSVGAAVVGVEVGMAESDGASDGMELGRVDGAMDGSEVGPAEGRVLSTWMVTSTAPTLGRLPCEAWACTRSWYCTVKTSASGNATGASTAQ